MTAVDRAELKRLAEGAGGDAWGLNDWRPEGQILVCGGEGHSYGLFATVDDALPDVAAFIAAANPAVVLALLSEIEGLKGEDQRNNEELLALTDRWEARALEAERQLADLRTQAPDSWRPDRALPRVEFHQHDWTPAFAAFLPDATAPEPTSKAFCVLNLAAFLGTVQAGDVPREDLPYFLAETMMHEIIHVLEQWGGVEFNEERVEALLEKYAALSPQTAESGK